MDVTPAREQLVERVHALLLNEGQLEALQDFSDVQLRELAETLGGLAEWTPDRRSENRKAVMCRVEVIVPTGTQSVGTQIGLQEDISASGARVLIPRAVSVGTRVRVRRNGDETMGTVQQCNREKFGYSIGVHYDVP